MNHLSRKKVIVLFLSLLLLAVAIFAAFLLQKENKEKKNCPAYIDCMPKIDGTPNCQMPPGCEGETERAY